MKAIKVADIKQMITDGMTHEQFALEMGISISDAKRVYAYAKNINTPGAKLAVLEPTIMNGITIMPGNIAAPST